MKINRESTGELTALLHITIEPADYKKKFIKALKDLRKKVDIRGFRRGLVPMGMMKRMYGANVLAEDLQKMLDNAIDTHIKEEQLNLLGVPLQKVDDVPFKLEPTKDKDYSFTFKLGLMPDFDIPMLQEGNDINVEKYTIAVADSEVEAAIERARKQHGEVNNPEEGLLQKEDSFNAEFVALDDNNEPIADGLTNETWLSFDFFTEEVQADLADLFVNDSIIFDDIFAISNKENVELAKFVLDVVLLEEGQENKAEATDKTYTYDEIPKRFRMSLKKVNRVEIATLDKAFFDKVHPNNNFVVVEDFQRWMREVLQNEYEQFTKQKFEYDLQDTLIETTVFNLPEDFLKEYIESQQKQEETPLSEEELTKRLKQSLRGMRWEVILSKLVKAFDVKISNDDIEDAAYYEAQQMLQRYMGGQQFDPNMIEKFAESQLQNQEYVSGLSNRLVTNRALGQLAETVAVTYNEVSLEEWEAIVKAQNAAIKAAQEVVEA